MNLFLRARCFSSLDVARSAAVPSFYRGLGEGPRFRVEKNRFNDARGATQPSKTVQVAFFHRSSSLHLNRILFDSCEIDERDEEKGVPTVTLPKDDYRTVHVANILNAQNGQCLRAGIVGEEDTTMADAATPPTSRRSFEGLVTDEAVVEWLPEGKIKKAQPTRNGKPPGSLRLALTSLAPPPASSSASVSLILALPRPLQLGRLLPMVAQLGVERLVLTAADKVPKDYFGSHLLREPREVRRLLVEGLCQADDVRLPRVSVVRGLRRFLTEDVDRLFPLDRYARALAHPTRTTSDNDGTVDDERRMRDVTFPARTADRPPRIVLAVGPEGGWEEDRELDMFKNRGFQQITLGTRILRSDVAVVSLLSLANDVCAARASSLPNESSAQPKLT